MKLEATFGFAHPSRFDKTDILECDTRLIADEAFCRNDYEKQAYALKLMGTELQAAVQRVNDRLRSEGLTKESFVYADPRYDAYGNPRQRSVALGERRREMKKNNVLPLIER